MSPCVIYENPLQGRLFTERQMYEIYRDLADKEEYPDFECWIYDMIKNGSIHKKELEIKITAKY